MSGQNPPQSGLSGDPHHSQDSQGSSENIQNMSYNNNENYTENYNDTTLDMGSSEKATTHMAIDRESISGREEEDDDGDIESADSMEPASLHPPENSGKVSLQKTNSIKSRLSIQGLNLAPLATDHSLYNDPEQRPPCFSSTFQECICIGLLIFSPASASMASSAFQASITDTANHFHISGGSRTWLASATMLGNGTCLLLMGGFADAFGRRNAILISFISYAVFALIGGFMQDFVALCIFRALQGAFVACGVPASAGFIGATYKNSKRKNMAMSLFAAGAPVGGAFGFFIGGVCAQVLSWRSVHYFLAILYLCFFITAFFVVPKDTVIDWSRAKQIFFKQDFVGALLSMAGFCLMCFSLTQSGAAPQGWSTPYIIALLIVGIFLIFCFVMYEIYIPKNPLMPMQLWKSKNFALCMVIVSFSWMQFFGVLNYNAVLYFEEIRGYSAIITACCFLTQPISGFSVNIFAGFTMHLIPGKVLLSVGCIGFLISSIIWETMSIDRNYFLGPFWCFIFTVLGADLIYNIANRCALSSVDRSLQSRAAGTFNTVIQLSSSIGLGISSTIITAKDIYYGGAEEASHQAALFHAFKYSYYFSLGLASFNVILAQFVKIGTVGHNQAPPAVEIKNNGATNDPSSKEKQIV